MNSNPTMNKLGKSTSPNKTKPNEFYSKKLTSKIRNVIGIDESEPVTSKDINKLVSECIKLKKAIEKVKLKKEEEKAKLKKAEEKVKLKKAEEIQEKDPDVFAQQHLEDFQRILRASIDVYAAFPFSGKEHHYQAALEEELREMGEKVYQEVAVTMNYKKRDGNRIQLPHDIRGREDLVLPAKCMVLELKQTGKLTDKEFNQICRYMEERRQYSTWGVKTAGMLINFGDNELECWGLYYVLPEGTVYFSKYFQKPRLTRVLLYKEERPPLSTFVDSYAHILNKSHPLEE